MAEPLGRVDSLSHMDTSKIWLVTFDPDEDDFEILTLRDLLKIGFNLYAEKNPMKHSLRVLTAHESLEEAQEKMEAFAAIRRK